MSAVFRGRRILLLALGLVLATTAGAQSQQTPSAPPAPTTTEPRATALPLEPKAIELLKASSSRLAAARTMRFTAVTSYESPSRLGPPLVYTTTSEVTLQRPNKLRGRTR